MTDQADAPLIDVAADNDVILKAACYGLTSSFWSAEQVGVLGAARFVLAKRVQRAPLARDVAAVQNTLQRFFDDASVLEPTEEELQLAASLEVEAQRRGLEVDAGESQLCAMVVHRAIPLLDTGDKRAICGLEHLLDDFNDLDTLCGRIRCLEQLVMHLLSTDTATRELTLAICSEPNVDKALSVVFSCYSEATTDPRTANQALGQYVASLRSEAPRLLAASP